MTPTPAKGIIAFMLRRAGFGGITLPSGIYILREHMNDHALIAHERIHQRQMIRLGMIRFYALYLYQWLRYGYEAMPLEREARGEL